MRCMHGGTGVRLHLGSVGLVDGTRKAKCAAPPKCHALRNMQSRGVGLGVGGELPGGAGEMTKEMHELEQSRSRRQ
jgi:hypothetical protein